MVDGAQQKIARMVAQGGLSTAEGWAALRLISAAEGTGKYLAPYQGNPVTGSQTAGNQRVAVNRSQQQQVARISDQRLLQSWQREMCKRGRDARVAIDVLVSGETLSAVDRRMKRRKGWARGEMQQGIYAFRDILAQQGKKTNLDMRGQKEYQIG